MKKITLLLSFIACVLFAQAQTNLVLNPSFETWTAGVPDSWTIPANAAHIGSLTASQETTLISNGTSALKVVIGTTQNPGIQQVIPITAGKTYTVKVSYYVVVGDLTDCRIWSSFKIGTAFFAAADWTTAIAADPSIQSKLQGSGTDITGYLTIANGTWGTYTVDFVAPANTTDFVLECRSYKNATVIWDNMFFGEKVAAGLSTPLAKSLEVKVIGKKLSIANAPTSTVEIFSALGTKVQTVQLVNGSTDLSNLSKGLYIVRIGKQTAKIMIQ